MKILIRDIDSNIAFQNFDSDCYVCEEKCNSEGNIVKCPKFPEEEIRHGKKRGKSGVFFLCANKAVAKTTAVFREKLDFLIHTLPTLHKIQEEIQSKTKQIEQERYERIVHNIKTINAQSIQEQYNLTPQDLLANNHQNQIDFIVEEIKKDTKKAAITFLRLIKNNADIKTEFTAHEKLSVENPILSKGQHSIRKIILNIFHAFSLEFKDKNITMSIFDNEKKMNLDYETIRLAFYHMFNNTSKYIKTNSQLNITCNDYPNSFTIIFKMISIHIMEDELSKIFEDNYSGVKVRDRNKQGKGMGLGLIKKALLLNNATIEVKSGNVIETKSKIDYSKNEFIITFKGEIN